MRAYLSRAVFSLRTLSGTGLRMRGRVTKLPRFTAAALRSTRGPNLALLFHGLTQPHKEAVVEYGERGVRRLKWGELHEAINRVCNALAARGVHAGDRVAIMLPNGLEGLLAQLALARLGATAVQVGYRCKAPEIAHILENAEPSASVFHARFRDVMLAARTSTGRGGPALVIDAANAFPDLDQRSEELADWDRAVDAAPPSLPRPGRRKEQADDDGGGVIIYTSGTTGKPKGARRSFRQTGFESATDLIRQVGMRTDDRHLVVCPLYHSAAPAFVALVLGLGGTVVLMNHFDPEAALAIIEKEGITSTLVVPTMLVRLCALDPAVRGAYNTSSLRWVLSGAAPLATDVARRTQALFGPILWNFYGATETGLVTLAGPADHEGRPGTIGRALRGVQIRLVDDRGAQVPAGEVGELYAKNETLIAGYHRNEEATNQASREGFFSVGDLGRVDDDGYYYLESRKHDMVISGGVNIYPREIEDHLHAHPAVLEAAVVGVPDDEWGERLRAFIVVRGGMTLSAADIVAHCSAGLADFKRPRQISFVDELPRNPTGKVLKRNLRETP